jgi:predicted cupin superfamily sugar epimerase
MRDAAYWISSLNLTKHPEGGFFRSTYASPLLIAKSALPPGFKGPRLASTAIYFLVDGANFSAFHRLQSDEVWHFYAGSTLMIHVIDADGSASEIFLGSNPESGVSFQGVVKAGCWFGARVKNSQSFALVGCTMAPGFDFEDFELATRTKLTAVFPQHRELIERLTRA